MSRWTFLFWGGNSIVQIHGEYQREMRACSGQWPGQVWGGRSCKETFIRPWPWGRKRIQDGGTGVDSGAGNKQVCNQSTEKASRDSNIQKKAPERMSQNNFWEMLNPLGSDIDLAKAFVMSFLDYCRSLPAPLCTIHVPPLKYLPHHYHQSDLFPSVFIDILKIKS